MELTNEFTIGLPIDEAWAMLTDLERVAPCMPGAELQSVEGDEYHGEVKVKVDLAADGQHTRVDVHTDLAITGKVAQFGRGVLADVSRKLMTQFVQCLEAKAADEPAAVVAPVAPVDLLAVSRTPLLKRLGPVALVVVAVVVWLVARR